MINFSDFEKVDIRVGKILSVTDFPEAHKPAYKLVIDFGPDIGTKQSSAQITDHYSKAELENRLVMAVVNFPTRQIGNFMSEVLTLGFADNEGKIVLATPDKGAVVGSRLF